MKKQACIIGISLIMVLLLSACTSAAASPASASVPQTYAGTVSEPREVTVTGDAEVRVVPDQVIITVGVETEDYDLNEAKEQNDEITQNVILFARGMGVKSNHIQTDYINITPEYDYSGSLRTLEGYRVRKTMVITLSKMDQFEGFLSGILERGVNRVHNIEFRTTELRKYRDQARSLAIQAAQEKAEALAGELGQSIGNPLSIREERNNVHSWYGYGWGWRSGSVQTQNVVVEAGTSSFEPEGGIAPGQITVSAQVSVSFEMR